MLFRERAIIAIELLKKQPPVTLEQARAQIESIKAERKGNVHKKLPPTAEKSQK